MSLLQTYNLLGHVFTQAQIDAFISRIVAGPNGCHICTYSLSKGYPQQTSSYKGRLRTVKVHRLAYAYYIGKEPGDQLVCHSCDEPRCVNPYHLFLGDNVDNIHDAVSKGRWTQGGSDLKWLHLLPDMRRYAKEGKSQREIAELVGLDQPTISRYLRRFGL